MKNSFLLDTHIFIWAMEDSKRLPQTIKSTITNSDNKIYISVATIWEISIKTAIKKMKLSFDIETSIQKTNLEVLPIQISHVLKTGKLPPHHSDPFDRIIIAQALTEKFTLITIDPKIKKYKVKILK